MPKWLVSNSLATHLYCSNTRFVFELLQNTDDNSYSVATDSGAEPYTSFKIFAENIVLECNEDGFTKEKLLAICDASQSSKIGPQGYIGEKGIGFKVCVHGSIQSPHSIWTIFVLIQRSSGR